MTAPRIPLDSTVPEDKSRMEDTHAAKDALPETDMRRLCVELQSCGIRAPDGLSGGRVGGAGPSEGRVIVIGGRYLNVPMHSWYVRMSPFAIESAGDRYMLTRNGRGMADVDVPPLPRYYALKTSDGIPLYKIALVHGRDCLASTIYQDCRYRDTPQQCTFCGIHLSLQTNATVLVKSPDDIASAVRAAVMLDGVAHVTLTAGHARGAFDLIRHYCSVIEAIKHAAGLAVHIQICPQEKPAAYRVLHAAGADTVGIHCESYDPQAQMRHAPAKAAIGLDTYRRHWEQAVAVFGHNQVSSFLIAGLGERPESICEGAESMARMGVFPYVLPLRPVPGTPLADIAPPSADGMLEMYRQVAGIVSRHGLSSRASKAGCVRCGACSCLSLFEPYNDF